MYSALISKPGNVSVRLEQSERSKGAKVATLVVEGGSGTNLERSTESADEVRRSRSEPGSPPRLRVRRGRERLGGEVGRRARNRPDVCDRGHSLAVGHSARSGRAQACRPDRRLNRPVDGRRRHGTHGTTRHCLVAGRAVRRPTGNGKNRLLNEILALIEEDPQSFGFTRAHEVVIEPAEEGWTTRDLVGGETVDENGQLRFRPGRVLDAVANDRWLVIDEANRADLDRIFGGLLTWLSGQQVVVGRASTRVGVPGASRLGGRPAKRSDGNRTPVVGRLEHRADRLHSRHRVPTPRNLQRARRERVFRFGLALGRRFAQVPVPPASVEDFETMLEAAVEGLESAVKVHVADKVVGLYRAHYSTVNVRLVRALPPDP